jgi:UDP-N-acetylmuramoyl-tripeptide--D-alanyl-D-alanine ligase
MSLSLLADTLNGSLTGEDAVFTGVGTDTRRLSRGELFVALQGPRFDGHNFLAEAIAVGAGGALLSRSISTAIPYVRVEDTRSALGRFAAFWRGQHDISLIAVTGSNGKTTVKEMIGAILASSGAGCITRGNLNNDIGVPLTLLRMRARDRFAVIEMGMNHVGEIKYLSEVARPTIALITNAGEAHLEGLGSIEAVARAKGEIFAGLPPHGIAVLNADDAYYGMWETMSLGRRRMSFGLHHHADVGAEFYPDGDGYRIVLKTPEGNIEVRFSLLGEHNVLNALAASAAALAAGASLADIRSGLEQAKAVAGRMELKQGISGARVIDDTYNANPSSLTAALNVLKEYPGEKVLVLGDMAELGADTETFHLRAGERAHQIGIQRIFSLGHMSAMAVAGFGKGARHFSTDRALIDALIDCMHSEMTILVKGSRVMRMERVVDGIVRRSGESDQAGRTY